MKTSSLIALALVLSACAAIILKAVVLVIPLIVSASAVILIATAKVYVARKLSKTIEENEDTVLQKVKEEVL